ncbi:MAG: hypothetical protein IMZ44_22995 [Planctomycetes bacterium]|nr:hypothetical protein [Planctomycetota bacterium]
MKHQALAAAIVAVLAACACAAPAAKTAAKPAAPAAKPKPAPREPTRAEVLVRRIRDSEARLRTEKDPAERQRFIDNIETCKHELGPRDPTGAKVQFAAMWHDGAIEALDAEYKRLAGRAKGGQPGAGTTLALEARANLRRMAAVCLRRGWTWGGTLPRYQYDAYGQYLANNLGTLDAMFDSVAAALAREPTLPPVVPDRAAFLAALAQVKEGCAKMNQAVETFTTAEIKTSRDRDTVLAALGTFHAGLDTVYEADGALRELAGKAPKSDSAAAPPPGDTEGPSAEEKASLEKIRAVAAALPPDSAWAKTREALERFVPIAEQGLQVQHTRPGAQELLHHLARTAEYVEGLTKSKAAYPEYVAARQASLEEMLDYIGKKGYRQYGYSHLRRIYEGDQDRVALEATPLTPPACQGILRAIGLRESSFTGADGERNFYAFYYGRNALMDVLGKLPRWSPKEMSPQLAPLYARFHEVFIQSAEAAGNTPPDDSVALKDAYHAAGRFGKDLERVVVADRAIRAVEQYLPARAGPMYADFIRRAEPLAGNLTVAAGNERPLLDQFLLPFQDLIDLELPGPQHQQAAAAFSGGAYKPALTMLGKQVTAGLNDAAKGRSDSLQTALEARWMFKTLRHRCVSEADGLAKAGVTNLDAFSMPEKTYSQFVAAIDGHLKRLLSKYAGEHIILGSPQCQFLWKWDSVYCMVGAAQRLTLKARHPGESDLDFLMRNLAQAADPAPPDSAWFGWAVGYHAVEAATCLAAGYDGTAGYHLGELKMHRTESRLDRELTTALFDPK